MDNLKNVIDRNRGLFEEELPERSYERFMEKVRLRDRRRLTISIISYSAAATLLLFFGLSFLFIDTEKREEREINRIYQDYSAEVAKLSEEILFMVSDYPEKDIEIFNGAIDIITLENIPFAEQLPQELSREAKAVLLKEYYSQKLRGIRQMKVLISHATDIEDYE